MFTLMKMMRV